jgi:WXG100 family type VII secretion target
MAPSDPGATMGGVTYRVTPEYLNGAAISADNTAAEIDAILRQIRQYIMTLDWAGMAHNTFMSLMQQYDHYALLLHNSLTGIASGLRGNYVNYTESEQVAISSLRAIDANLPAGNQTIAPMNLG